MASMAASGVVVLAWAGATPASADPNATLARAGAALASRAGFEHGTRAELFEFQQLESFLTPVTSSTGAKLYVSFSFSRQPGTSPGEYAGVLLDTTNEREGHSWQFPIGKGALTIKPSGSGSLRTGSQLGAYGALSVTFTATASKRVDVCNASNYTLDQTERFRGRLHFDTHSTGRRAWGKVGTATRPFSLVGQTDLYTYYSSSRGCTPKTATSACYNFVYWSDAGKRVTFAGSSGDYPSTIYASRTVDLPAPIFSIRTDIVRAKAPAPVLTTRGKAATLKVTTSGDGVRGSGTIRSTDRSIFRSKCKGGSETQTSWYDATFTPGSPTLSAREQIFGTIRLPAAQRTAVLNSYTS